MQFVSDIQALYRIFRKHKWTDKDIDEFVFNNFCELFENLDDVQRILILELVEKYSWISYAEYQARLINVFNSVEEDKLDQLNSIYIFPIIKKEDEGKSKSGTFVCYLIKALKPFLTRYKSKKFYFPAKFDDLAGGNFDLKDGKALFLVDDYVGSGATLNSCLTTLRQNPDLNNNGVNVLSIVAQKEVMEKIIATGVAFYSDIISMKGISDFNASPVLDDKLRIMLEIEKLIPGGSHFSLGYDRSEALITMMRTPDNTFPIFWKKYRKNGKKFDAPFSRVESADE